MTTLPIYQIDAFADRAFNGNPAAVMPLDNWLADELLQAIAMENNLSETAFIVAGDENYALRWFTPEVEVDLCGHATLAAAHALFEHLGHAGDELVFDTRSGELRVSRSSAGLTLDFPVIDLKSQEVDMSVCNALGAPANEAMAPASKGGAVLYVYASEDDVAGLSPDFAALLAATDVSVIVTAPGNEVDFVSRFFGPQVGLNEDPVTGSAHCSLVPYWAERMGKSRLQARQISQRGGNLDCELRDGRVFMTGTAVTFMQGTVELSLAR
ncbi:MAG: PhzF family phenazine biosynthesis protein [Halioglobus sp.]|jgi:PhzF family phenazine biosynthesis protein